MQTIHVSLSELLIIDTKKNVNNTPKHFKMCKESLFLDHTCEGLNKQEINYTGKIDRDAEVD